MGLETVEDKEKNILDDLPDIGSRRWSKMVEKMEDDKSVTSTKKRERKERSKKEDYLKEISKSEKPKKEKSNSTKKKPTTKP